jgi:probable F420-dependent oxidoreductase
MKYGMSIVVRGDEASRDTFNQMADKAEACGLDTLWASDHLIMPALRVSRYPGRADGQLPDGWKQRYFQPFSVLNYLAARTRHVRLGTSVLILPMRNPIEVAAQVAELDQLSEGRVNLGVGVGWFREEFEALGYAFSDRGARTDEDLGIIKALWTQPRTSIDGPTYRFTDAEMGPKPVQRPHPPIYVGGNTAAAMRRAARYGDAWHPFKVTPEAITKLRPALQAALETEGRSAREFPVAPKVVLAFQDSPPRDGQALTEGRPQDIIGALRRFRDAGATEFCFDIVPETLGVALDTLDRFANEVRPKV